MYTSNFSSTHGSNLSTHAEKSYSLDEYFHYGKVWRSGSFFRNNLACTNSRTCQFFKRSVSKFFLFTHRLFPITCYPTRWSKSRKAFSQENGTKPIELPCFQKVICFPWIHSLINVKQLDKELFGVPTLNNGLFSTHFFYRSDPSQQLPQLMYYRTLCVEKRYNQFKQLLPFIILLGLKSAQFFYHKTFLAISITHDRYKV